MKKILPKFSLLALFIITLTVFIGCTKEEDEFVPDQLSIETKTSELHLTSPNGFRIAKSKQDFLKSLSKINGLSTDSIEIVDIKYMESKVASAAFVSYKVKGNEFVKNIAIGKGKIEFSTNKLQVHSNNTRTLKADGESSAVMTASEEGPGPTVSCHGCTNCRVGGSIEPNGTIHFKCESSCCSMTITYPTPAPE
ncbi:hypothetical protein [Pontibacter sp. HSC-36F09]|uniref:hypothetical protein n=1 Tax=Pontibacter sp. HSC-36F09 TaxID=2910966 RepID=UPI00209EA532|nr:hypothetical protein [Pontibacter sp. HSC-36F09]MCP2042906.1 hypothetical protein [Pontibacter sp. HSC-36F09]